MNRLAQETSPYLLQHADNPVDWYPWGDEALSRARAEDKPILLSVGYSACHWCHVMEHESFEDAATARLMNEQFVSIKVDREERPDVDAVYMDAVVAISGHGGWPMTVFLTPDGEPFFGGTYYPPEPRHGLPSFRQVLVAVSEAYRERREDVSRQAQALVEAVRVQSVQEPSSGSLGTDVLDGAVETLRSQVDPDWGGFGRAPKFPPASPLEFLLRRGELDASVTTLDAMALGGMYDVVGGGFHRYSVDERWLVPHFEKMLYDNALLVPAYLHGWALTGDERYRDVVARTVDYMLRELWIEGEGFASSQDADTDGVEGLTYTWAPGEGAPEELLEPFEGGRFILRGELDEATRLRLLEIRERRPQPGRDDKVITSWNGLALAALAEAGRMLERPDLLELRSGAGRADDVGRDRPLAAGQSDLGRRLPRRLREPRARPLRAARRDGRPALAARIAASRAARARAVPRRGARRVLHDRARGRRARHAQEGLRRPPDAVRQLDARVRPAPARADLGRRRARAAPRSGSSGWSCLSSHARLRRSAGRSPRSISISPHRGSSRSSPTLVTTSRGPRSLAGTPTRSSRSALPTTFRCSRERIASTGSRRSTIASGSPAARRSRMLTRSLPTANHQCTPQRV